MNSNSHSSQMQLKFVGLVWVLASLFFIASCVYRVTNGSNSKKWTHVQGQIITSEIVTKPYSGSMPHYKLRIRYAYVIDQEEHQGYQITYHGALDIEDQDFNSYQLVHAKSIIAKYPLGKDINVYVNPDNDDDAVLEPGTDSQSWMGVFMGVPFLGLGLLFLTRTQVVYEYRREMLKRANSRITSVTKQ